MIITANNEPELIEIRILSKLESWDLLQIESRKPTVKGVIHGVHKSITNEERTGEMTSTSPIIKAERLQKRVNGQLEPTTCVVILFES